MSANCKIFQLTSFRKFGRARFVWNGNKVCIYQYRANLLQRERGFRVKSVLTLLVLAACALSATGQVPSDVPREHWAYEAVQDLAEKGFVLGYPDGNFLGSRSMTRYEFATVIKRILDSIEEKIAAVNVNKETTAKPYNPDTATKAGISADDIEKVNKLIDEFKVELTVIGTRLDKIEKDMEDLQGKVENIDAIVTDPEGALESTRADVSKLKKIKVSGYVQARYTAYDNQIDKADTKFIDNFNVRRARLKVTGKPTDKSSATVQFDAGQGFAGDKVNSVSIKDAFLNYYFGGAPELGINLEVGQFKWPFGYETIQSSSVRETPERSLLIGRFFPGERDKGIKFFSPIANATTWQIGLFNGSGTSYPELNDAKDVCGTIRHNFGSLDLGVSGYWGRGIYRTNSSSKDVFVPCEKVRYGFDAELYMSNASLKFEWIRGRGVDKTDPTKFPLAEWIDGYWAQLAFNLNVKNTLIAKYDTLSKDPLYPSFGRRSAWNFGLVHYLNDKTRFKAFYQINKEEKNEIPDNNGWVLELITTF